MWFKQAKVLQLKEPIAYDIEHLEAQFAQCAFQPCLPSLPATQGWVSPLEKEDAPFIHSANNYWLICLQLAEKVLPAAIVREELKQQVKQLEATRVQRVSQKERRTLKEEIINTLLPRAFTKLSRIHAYLDTKNNWLIINTTTATKVTKLVETLKRTLPEIRLEPLPTKKIPPLLTQWLANPQQQDTFLMNNAAVLKDPNRQKRSVRCQEQDLYANSIQLLLQEGYEINQLALSWQDRVSFTLIEDFALKNIRYHEEVLDLAKDNYGESSEQRFDADFAIMTANLSHLLKDIYAEIGKDN